MRSWPPSWTSSTPASAASPSARPRAVATRALPARAGWVAVGLLLASSGCVVALHLLRRDLDPIAQRLSAYAIGPHGALMTAVFWLLGGGLLALAAALLGSPHTRGWARAVPALVAVAGVGLILSGVFRTDPRIPPPPGEILHTRVSVTGLLALVAATLLWSSHLLATHRSVPGARASLALALVAGAAALAGPPLHDTPWSGLGQRVLWLVLMAWLLLTAWQLVSGRARAGVWTRDRVGILRGMAVGREIKNFLMDMDGVLVHEDRIIPGADDFVRRLQETGRPFLILTNNSRFTPRDLRARLHRIGIEVDERNLWTSAQATAQFLSDQRPGGSAQVIGEAGLTMALHDVGYVLTDQDPDYLVLGETRTYSFTEITRAIRAIERGARFIATNPDPTGPSPDGTLPATGSVAALVTHATGVAPYFVGKPNALMMRSALRAIDAHSEETVMIGDRMDTDIVAGLEAGLETILVLTGISTPQHAERYPYRPHHIVGSVADVEVT
jgi:NagD protein